MCFWLMVDQHGCYNMACCENFDPIYHDPIYRDAVNGATTWHVVTILMQFDDAMLLHVKKFMVFFELQCCYNAVC